MMISAPTVPKNIPLLLQKCLKDFSNFIATSVCLCDIRFVGLPMKTQSPRLQSPVYNWEANTNPLQFMLGAKGRWSRVSYPVLAFIGLPLKLSGNSTVA